jgi:hypothetical protein
MTETNINALCSVEAVFDGVDIEVTVEFSAGGGTFKHDELTAESRAKADQHPIESITGLQSALDGKSNVGHGHDISGISGLTLADSPEFADTQITPLSVEATYTPTVWSYLVGLFTTVPKSVKSHIVKIWERLGLLEDTYILKYVVPVDTTAINLTTDRYGNALNLTDITIIADIQYTGPSGMSLRINNINGELYRNYNLDPYASVKYRDRFFIESSTSFILQKSVIELFILSNEVVLTAQTRAETATPTYVAGARGVSNTVGMNINAITTINILSYNVANSIKAGSVILIKKR